MFVIKRDGKKEVVHFDKITSRINKLCYGLDAIHVDAVIISQKVIQGVYPGVTTIELDELAAQTAASCATRHPDFSTLAARISVSNLHKQTSKVFSEVVEILHSHVHPKTGQASPLVSEEVYEIVMEVRDTPAIIAQAIIPENPPLISIPSFQYTSLHLRTRIA